MTRPGEKGAIRKPWGSRLPVALVFPNAYRIGMGNLGFQFLYQCLNSCESLVAERFFLPESEPGKRGRVPEPRSEESALPLSHFSVVAFSIPFENDYPAVPKMLMAAGIPPLQKDRRLGDPLVIAGGVSVSMNPEPLAPFLDLVFIGEVPDEDEGSLVGLLAELGPSITDRIRERDAFLRDLRDAPGVYVPSFYSCTYRDAAFESTEPLGSVSNRRRAPDRTAEESPAGKRGAEHAAKDTMVKAVPGLPVLAPVRPVPDAGVLEESPQPEKEPSLRAPWRKYRCECVTVHGEEEDSPQRHRERREEMNNPLHGLREETLSDLQGSPVAVLENASPCLCNGLCSGTESTEGFPPRIRAVKRRARGSDVPVSVLFSPDAEFGEALLVETNRGCSRKCRFCASGWIHFPVRYRSLETFRQRVDEAISLGRSIGLIGSDLAGHPELERILEYIVDQGGSFSLSSIRPEGLTPRVIELLAATGQKTATLAPEAASPRMKRVLGKEIPSERFLDLVARLVSAGIPNIRYYFMVGLPTETDEDAAAIADFVLQSREVFVEASRPKGRIGSIGVQVNPFVPKPWTPFQWAPMARPEVLERRIRIIRERLGRVPNVRVRAESVREAVFQAFLARGDRRTADVLLDIARAVSSPSSAFRKHGLDPEFHLHRERGELEPFPWDLIDHGISKEALWKAYIHAVGNRSPIH